MLRKYTIRGAAELAATLAAITQAKPDALNPDNPEQFKRFVQTARETGAVEQGDAFWIGWRGLNRRHRRRNAMIRAVVSRPNASAGARRLASK